MNPTAEQRLQYGKGMSLRAMPPFSPTPYSSLSFGFLVQGSGWRGRWEGRSGWGTHVNPWLFHFNVWQNPLQKKKKKKKEKKRKTRESSVEWHFGVFLPLLSTLPHKVNNKVLMNEWRPKPHLLSPDLKLYTFPSPPSHQWHRTGWGSSQWRRHTIGPQWRRCRRMQYQSVVPRPQTQQSRH